MQPLHKGVYTSLADSAKGHITVRNGTEALIVIVGEGVTAKRAVSFASTMLGLTVLPENIAFTPFRVRFLEDGSAKLVKAGFGEVSFNEETVDDLITILDQGIGQVQDQLRIRGGARAGVSSVKMPDPII